MRVSFTANRVRLVISAAILFAACLFFVYEVRRRDTLPFESFIAILSGLALLMDLRLDAMKEPDRIGDYKFDSQRHRKIRENVLANVRTAYLDGYLHNALHETVRIKLELDHVPTALKSQVFRMHKKSGKENLVTDADIGQMFDSSGRAMLILGAPGSGKTIMLLELCQSLLTKAEQDPEEPVPVVLNLATWAEHKREISDWIVQEMDQTYRLSTQVAQLWLNHDHFCLLLDGLDEVQPVALRDECVRAINRFLAEYTPSIVVSSRLKDYEVLSEQLHLSEAIAIQPLTDEQIEEYLTDERLDLAAVYEAVIQNEALREITSTPLVLNVMALAYRGAGTEQLRPFIEGNGDRLEHLYRTYITRQLETRAKPDVHYGPKQILSWLKFLANRLNERNEFFVEDLQPGWLPDKELRKFKMLSGLAGIFFSCVFGILIGVLIAIFAGLTAGVFLGLQVAVWFGVLFGLLGAGGDTIEPADELVPPKLGIPDFHSNRAGALYGGCFGGAYGGLVGFHYGDLSGMVIGVIVGGPIGILVGMVVDSVEAKESSERKSPNQGIRQSANNSIRGSILGGLFVAAGVGLIGAIVGVITGGTEGAETGALYGALTGFVVGAFVSFLHYGGMVVVRHYLLRFVMHRAGLLPFQIVPFLETMHRDILMVKGGPHYRFIHGTFKEYIGKLTWNDFEMMADELAT